ncbi:MAG: hypothetical protein DRP83_10045 [Planctomycetota bacterium]|nr:MAG: hypothetical protein DRP83_10045 [Planctomycetota bacterium]
MTKLTLSADENIVREAKRIAHEQNMSVSALFARFVQSMVLLEWTTNPPGPIAKKASGLVSLPSDRTDKDILAETLAQRHGSL